MEEEDDTNMYQDVMQITFSEKVDLVSLCFLLTSTSHYTTWQFTM